MTPGELPRILASRHHRTPLPRDRAPLFHLLQDITVAKPNYNFEKRQREIAKKKQQDEKQAKKRAARENNKPAETAPEPPADPQ